MSFLDSASSTILSMMASGSSSQLEPEDDLDIPAICSPVWILGENIDPMEDRQSLKDIVQTRLWMSYRHDFHEIETSTLTSDKGWGCMLRCGQMVVAEALIRVHLGKAWRWKSPCRDEKYLKILRLFEDNKDATYSIHRIAVMGESNEVKKIGTWFGPNTIAHTLRRLSLDDPEDQLTLHVAMDSVLIIDEVKEASRRKSGSWRPLLLFVSLRLGLTQVNPTYFRDLKNCFDFPQMAGIIGGKPNHALYFLGYFDDELIYLDPHTSQPAGSVGENLTADENALDQTYHTLKASRLHMSKIDPSLALCFFCKDEADFDDLCQRLHARLYLGHTAPLIDICRQRPSHMQEPFSDPVIVKNYAQTSNNTSDDEYELL